MVEVIDPENVYYGIPDERVWNGTGFFGIVNAEEPYKLKLRDFFGIVPIFNFAAAYYNFYTWGSAQDAWTLAYSAQAFAGITSAAGWGFGYLFGYGALRVYAMLHLILEGVNVAAVYFAEKDHPNNTNNATSVSYLSAGVSSVMSIILIAFGLFGNENEYNQEMDERYEQEEEPFHTDM